MNKFISENLLAHQISNTLTLESGTAFKNLPEYIM